MNYTMEVHFSHVLHHDRRRIVIKFTERLLSPRTNANDNRVCEFLGESTRNRFSRCKDNDEDEHLFLVKVIVVLIKAWLENFWIPVGTYLISKINIVRQSRCPSIVSLAKY